MHYIKEYTDCQLRVGLIKWLMCFMPASGKAFDDGTVLDKFEKAIYSKIDDSETTLISVLFEEAKNTISPHLGIRDRPPQAQISKSKRESKGSKKATQDLIELATSFGFLSKPSVKGSRAISKFGSYFLKLTGGDSDLNIKILEKQTNPLILDSVERRYLFLNEIRKDPALLSLIYHLATEFHDGEEFVRTGEQGKKIVNLLIKSFEELYSILTAKRKLTEARDLKKHISRLKNDISTEPKNESKYAKLYKIKKSEKDTPKKGGKTAKHRLTPRLEHLTDYKLLSPHQSERGNEFTWSVSSFGYRAQSYLENLPDDYRYISSSMIPNVELFTLHRSIHFFSEAENLPATLVDIRERKYHSKILTLLARAYNQCAPRFGHSDFLNIAIIASLYGLEESVIIEPYDFFIFVKEELLKDPSLVDHFSFASRFEPNKLHIKIDKKLISELIQ